MLAGFVGKTVALTQATNRIYSAFGRSETVLVARGSADVNNDGKADEMIELAYESGAARGSGFNYSELASDAGSIRQDAANRVLNLMQGSRLRDTARKVVAKSITGCSDSKAVRGGAVLCGYTPPRRHLAGAD